MKTQFTPGPWRVGPTALVPTVTRIQAGHALIASVYRAGEGDSQREGNARLIAAAPDLLAALQKIAYEPFGASDATHATVLNDITTFARAAIAKAQEGKS